MKHALELGDTFRRSVALTAMLALAMLGASCSRESSAAPSKGEITLEPGTYNVDHPELFKLTKAETHAMPTELMANGTVTPDITRTIHVTSLGSGRVMDLRARLGDVVKKGQTLLLISSPDLVNANSDYQKARADEELSSKALARTQELYSHGALAAKDLESAQDTEDKAKVDLQTTAEHVRVLGGDPEHPKPLLDLRAPVSGTIVEQNVAGAEGIKSLDNTPNLFTIADLSQVWVVCDVFENDLGEVHQGDAAEIRLNAYPDRVFHGRVANISSVLDPTTRSAKVRIVLPNPDGVLRPEMFAAATFRSRKLHDRVIVPTSAVMRLQDKDWVFRKEGSNRFRRIEVHTGGDSGTESLSLNGGLNPGDEIIANALQFSSAMAEQKE